MPFGSGEVRQVALVDPVGAGDDPALGRLTEHLRQPHDRHRLAGDQVGQDLARTNRGELVDVAHDQQRRAVGNRLHQRLHQHDVDHRGLVHNEQVAVERIIRVALESSGLRIDLQQPVNGLRLEPGRLGHALGGTPGRCAQEQFNALRRQDTQDGVDDRGLPDPRPACDHENLGQQRQPNGCNLAFCERQAGLLLDPRQGLHRVDEGPRQGAVRQAPDAVGNGLLGVVEACKEDASGFADRVRDDGSVAQFQLECGLYQLARDFQKLDGQRRQFIGRQAAMTVVHRFGQRVGDTGTNTDHRRLFDAELHGDRVGGLESDAPDVSREPIGILGHDLDGVGAVSLVDPHGASGADRMAVQEDHDLANDLLLGPCVGDALGAHPANPGHFAQPVWFGLDDVEHLLAERLDHLPGVDGADAADHAGAEVFLDAVDRRRRRGAHEALLELLTVGPVVDPFARRGDPFAGGDGGGVPHHRDQIAMAARLDAENAEAVVAIVVGDAFNQTRDHFSLVALKR